MDKRSEDAIQEFIQYWMLHETLKTQKNGITFGFEAYEDIVKDCQTCLESEGTSCVWLTGPLKSPGSQGGKFSESLVLEVKGS